MKNLGLILFACIMIAGMSCTSGGSGTAYSGKGTQINGAITGGANLQAFLDKIQFDNSNTVVSSVPIDGNGKFEMKLPDGIEAGIYRLRIGAVKTMLIFDGSEKGVAVTGDLATMPKGEVSIEGSKLSADFCNMVKEVQAGTMSLDAVNDYAKNSNDVLAAALASRSLLGINEKYLGTVQGIAAKMNQNMPGTQYTKDFTTYTSQLAQQIAAQKVKQRIRVGQPAPDIKLDSPDGKSYALSDLKGKVVLLDFWASWCGPCRKANPHVVDLYNKYNKQGFEVFSVSLDGINPRARGGKSPDQLAKQLASSKQRWIQAIEKDKLRWPYHVSDLQHWKSAPAGVYGVSGIPRTFMIDKDGVIAAVNPRGAALEQELKKLL